MRIDDGITLAGDLAAAARAQAILLVVPAQAVRGAATALAPLIAPRTPVIVCAKGIERGTKKFMSDLLAECAPQATPAILSAAVLDICSSYQKEVRRRSLSRGAPRLRCKP